MAEGFLGLFKLRDLELALDLDVFVVDEQNHLVEGALVHPNVADLNLVQARNLLNTIAKVKTRVITL